MARPKKDAPAPAAPELTTIPVQDFLRTRDSVVTGLTTLQGSISQLMQAYVNHCNILVGGGTSSSLDISNFLTNPSSTEPQPFPAAVAGAAVGDVKQRRKRVKKEKDPNAPKRPLTAYFLYSHHARDIIKNDLEKMTGAEPKSQEIQNEATKRWNSMTAEDKKGWTDTYNTNYEKYKIEVAAYQAKKKQEALEAGVPEELALADAAIASESDDEIPPPKAPTPPTTKPAAKASAPASTAKKPRKNAKAAANGVTASPAPANSKAVVTPVPLPTETPKTDAKPASKKRKKPEPKEKETPASKAAAAAAATPAADEEPKKKKPRKSASKVAEEKEAPAPAEPEKKKRKRKSEAAS